MLQINKIYFEDCLEGMKKIDDGSVDMILCDLPYGTTSNKWDIIIPLDQLWKQYKRILKINGVVALTTSQPFTSMVVLSNLEMYKHEWIWIKNRGSNFANTVREPMKEHESVLIFSRGKWTYNKQMQERTGGGRSRVNYDISWMSKSKNYRDFDERKVKGIGGTVQKNKGGKKSNGENSENYGNFEGKDIILSELRVPSSWQNLIPKLVYILLKNLLSYLSI
jgi:DNA modification methylase